MKINIAKSAGFCLGVKRALDIAKKTISQNKQVYMLGDIVHNTEVINQIKKMGIKKSKQLSQGPNKTILIRAHGAPKKTYQKASQLGYQIVDATCPMVKEIHSIAQRYEKNGYKIIVIGDKKHAEVQGIVGQLNKKAMVLPPTLNPNNEKFKKIKKAALIVQSTQDIEKVKKIAVFLQKKIKNLKFINTICAPTRAKQNEIKKMPHLHDVMLIIGSKRSANTKRLYQISKRNNPKSYWIENEEDIKVDWLKNVKSVGITAGSSTPQSSIQKAAKKIKKITETKQNR